MTTLTVRLGERAIVARVDAAGAIHLDGQSLQVVPSGDGTCVVSDGERRWQVAVAGGGEACWVSIDGQIAVFEVEAGQASQARKKSARADAMMAPMPATVLKVLVEPGQGVAEGDTVLVLEAMKMELPVRAARAGVVAAVHCVQGELVQPGVALIALE